MEIYNISSDYVMARPERTDIRARYYLLSGDHSPLWGWGHYKLESFNELTDYRPSLSTLTLEGGDLHRRLLH